MRPTGLLVPGATYEYECSNVSCLFLGRRHPLLVLAPLSCEHRAVSLSICLLAQASQRMASPLQPAGLVLKRPRLVGGERPASRAIHPAHRRFVKPINYSPARHLQLPCLSGARPYLAYAGDNSLGPLQPGAWTDRSVGSAAHRNPQRVLMKSEQNDIDRVCTTYECECAWE